METPKKSIITESIFLLFFYFLTITAIDETYRLTDPFKNSENIKKNAQESIKVLKQEKDSLERYKKTLAEGTKLEKSYALRLQEVENKINNLTANLSNYEEAQKTYTSQSQSADRDKALAIAQIAESQIEADRIDLATLLEQTISFSPAKSQKALEDLINVRFTASALASSGKKSARILELNDLAANLIGEASRNVQEAVGDSFINTAQSIRQVLNTIPKPLTSTDQVNAATQAALRDFTMQKNKNSRAYARNLDTLNLTYKKVIVSLKKLDPKTKFPDEISLESLKAFSEK